MAAPKSLLAEVRDATSDAVARVMIERAMKKHRGHQGLAAEELGIDRRLLARDARRAGIDWAALVAESTGKESTEDPTKAA